MSSKPNLSDFNKADLSSQRETNAVSLKSITTSVWPHFLLTGWVLLRLPVLLAALYLFAPDEFVWLGTISAIHLVGTWPERIIFFVVICLISGGSFMVARKLPSGKLGSQLPLVISFGLFFGLYELVPGPSPLMMALFLTGVLGVNTLSDSWLVSFISKKPGHLTANIIFGSVIGFSELLLVKPLLLWLSSGQGWISNKISKVSWNWLPIFILTPGLAALFLNPYSLADLHRTLFPDPAVHLFTRNNISWTQLDLTGRNLYASGYDLNYLQAYNLDELDQPPRLSPIESGYAQGFAYNPLDQEVYIHNILTGQLLVLDASTLELKRSISIPSLSPGDVWLAWDQFSDSIAIASEADEQIGVPTAIVGRQTGQVLDRLNLDPGNLALHPGRPWLYMSFLRRVNELLVYDMQRHQIIKHAPAPERLDRMIFAPGEHGLDLFVSAPLDAQVLWFDAETLERKGTIPTVFGGRAIAVDAERRLLLCGSLVTHTLEVIDLTTGQRMGQYYLGPWLRTIVLDTKNGMAYVASHGGLFSVRYADTPDK
jgi:hypothetical protein